MTLGHSPYPTGKSTSDGLTTGGFTSGELTSGEFDAASVRGLFTSLGDGWTYFNANQAPQVPERVISAVSRAFRSSFSLLDADVPTGSHSAPRRAGRLEAETLVASARTAVADLLGGSAECVVLGPSLPVLYASLSRAMQPLLRQGSSMVLSRLDAPILTTALASGAPVSESGGLAASAGTGTQGGTTSTNSAVRWAQPDLGTGELPAYQYDELVDGSTRLVAFSAGNDTLGTVAPFEEIVDKVRERSRAWTLIDVTSYAAYRVVDLETFDADILAVDLERLGGPQISALVFRDVAMFQRLDALVPGFVGPEATKLETPVSSGLAGAVSPLIDHIAGIVESQGSRRQRLVTSMFATGDYLEDLGDDLYAFMSTLPTVHIIGITGESAAEAGDDRLPALTFAVRGVPAETVHQRLFDNGLVATIAPDTPLLQDMGIDELGGGVTVSLSAFNTSADVDHLIRVVASLA